MKLKHNKKRNTAFLYESLIKEFTIAIIKKDNQRQDTIKNILKEFFSKNKPLKKELDIYNTLLEHKSSSRGDCYRLMHEVKRDFFSLDRKMIFNEQTRLLKKINESLSNKFFATFLSNYRDIATIGQFLNSENLPARQRIILEDKAYNLLSSKDEERKEFQHIDNLTFKSFINKFNETYKNTLREEQRTLLTHYITSFANNGVELKSYINEELTRIRSEVNNIIKEGVFVEKFNLILEKINDFGAAPIDEEKIKEVFYLQDLIHEVNKNGR